MRWAFELEFRNETSRYTFVSRYHQQVSDETQIRWALEDFTGELYAAGVKLGDVKAFLPTPQTTPLRNIPIADAHRWLA
jgi:hypothetical protein